MAALRGWAPRGQRLPAKVPHGRWKTMTFLAALRHDRVEAPWLIDGPINGECFTAYVERVLLPTLRSGDIVIMDNLGSHRGQRRAASHSLHRGKALLPAQILTRPQSDRDALCQAQTSSAQGSQANRGYHLQRNRPKSSPASLHKNAPTTSNRPGMTQPSTHYS